MWVCAWSPVSCSPPPNSKTAKLPRPRTVFLAPSFRPASFFVVSSRFHRHRRFFGITYRSTVGAQHAAPATNAYLDLSIPIAARTRFWGGDFISSRANYDIAARFRIHLECLYAMTNSPASKEIGKASDHLANERTFLAWIRTSISIIVFGFVVAKFGITLREFLRVQGNTAHESGTSLMIGVGFMAMGIFIAIAAWFRYRNTMRRLETGGFKPAGPIVAVLAIVAVVFGTVLAVYLIYTANTL